MMTTTTTELDRTNRTTTPPAPSRFLPRVTGTLRLDRATAREIARAPEAYGQAVVVVLGATIAGMILSPPDGFGGALFALAETYATWFLSALVVAGVMPTLVGTPTTRTPRRDATLRLLGFAQAPLLIGLLGVIDLLAGIAGLAGWVLMMVATAFAVRQLLGVSWMRAAIATVVTRLAVAVLFGTLGIVLQVGDGILSGIV